jgi:hypothetical protein
LVVAKILEKERSKQQIERGAKFWRMREEQKTVGG